MTENGLFNLRRLKAVTKVKETVIRDVLLACALNASTDQMIQHEVDCFPLESKEYIKYLGILIDKNLTWKHHIDTVSLKINKTVGLFAKLRHFVPRQILLKIYQSLIYPHITYGLAA